MHPGTETSQSAPLPALVWEDSSLLVLNKPAGLLSVPGRGPDKQHCLSSLVQQRYPDALVVHRLDMGTSGLLVMARGATMQARLSASFAQRTVVKRYQAIVHGDCRRPGHGVGTGAGDDKDWHTIDLPILIDWPRRPLRIIDAAGQPSMTRWRCVAYAPHSHTSRLELEPLTGRSHQLRVHLQALGHPILGDAWYAPAEVAAASPRLLLHACALGFPHPAHGQWMDFECPDDFGRCPETPHATLAPTA